MANIPVDDGLFLVQKTIEGAGTVRTLLNTENNFLDKDIKIEITTPAGALGAGTGSVEASSDTGMLGEAQSTQPASGHYIKVEGAANVPVATEGYLETTDNTDVSIADVYYPVASATFTRDGASIVANGEGYIANGATAGTIPNGVETITGGGLTAGAGSAAAVSNGLSDGSAIDGTAKVALAEVDAAGYYKVTVTGYGSVNRAAVTKQVTTAGYFAGDADPVTEIAADSLSSNTAEKAYYIKQSTLSTDSVTPSTSAQTVTISSGYHHGDRTVTVAAMAPGTATSSIDEEGTSTYFNAGTSSDYDVALTPQHSITTAGYLAQTSNPVDGTTEYLKIKEQTVTETATTVSGNTVTRGTRTESAGWKDSSETLDVASISTTASSGHNYVDISNGAPVLVAGGNLYINAGWTDDIMISTAHLVPDGTNIQGHADYILYGMTALDQDGNLITGSIPTYQGAYTDL